MLWGFNMSPDGQTVAFQYCEQKPRYCRLGLFHLATGQIVHIPGPAGKSLEQPSFSSDGRRLAAITGDANSREGSHVVVIDLANLQITQLTEGRADRSYPAFQPGTDNILYVAGYVIGATHRYFRLRLYNVSKRTETTILAAKDGFRSGLLRPSFLGSDEVIFGAIAHPIPGSAKWCKSSRDPYSMSLLFVSDLAGVLKYLFRISSYAGKDPPNLVFHRLPRPKMERK
jgi:hypothetical protein